jgi:hypothetical protein
MAKFTTCVRLKDASPEAQRILDAEMENQGFSRTVEASDGRLYAMPDAEFDFNGDLERKDVLEKAKTAVMKTGARASILVTESKGRTWHGLETI